VAGQQRVRQECPLCQGVCPGRPASPRSWHRPRTTRDSRSGPRRCARLWPRRQSWQLRTRSLYRARGQHQYSGLPEGGSPFVLPALALARREGALQSDAHQRPFRSQGATLPNPSRKAIPSRHASRQAASRREESNPPSNVLPMRPRAPSRVVVPEGGSLGGHIRPEGGSIAMESHVSAFIGERLQKMMEPPSRSVSCGQPTKLGARRRAAHRPRRQSSPLN